MPGIAISKLHKLRKGVGARNIMNTNNAYVPNIAKNNNKIVLVTSVITDHALIRTFFIARSHKQKI